MTRTLVAFLIALCSWPVGLTLVAGQDSLPPVADPVLDRVAAELALSGDGFGPRVLRHALRQAGSDRITATARLVQSRRARSTWLNSMAREAEGPIRFGEAITEDGRLVVAAEQAGSFQLTDTTVTFRLAAGFRDAYLVSRTNRGSERLLPASSDHFELAARPDTNGLELQLVATGPSGPRPVAQRLFGTIGQPTIGTDDVSGRVKDHRTHNGVGSLRENRQLDRVADDHARTICESGRVRHGTRNRGPEARLRHHGLRARLVGEVAARATSVAAAFDAIVDSPSHELTLADRRFTDVGFGDAEDERGRACLVVLLAAWPQPVGR